MFKSSDFIVPQVKPKRQYTRREPAERFERPVVVLRECTVKSIDIFRIVSVLENQPALLHVDEYYENIRALL